ncbi:MAG: hypothetical protein CMA57_00195 [Euryarchaeota archaeon]|jgi:hypothetical protein|nr:hypothetical protein [Euryarchaeota archaeon]|tara:strand:- start:508 stop:945 length:438 start_codon:yes stop_codon:yes gene_type:complete
MQEEFYAIIKLISGEEVFALVSIDDSGDEPVIILQSPVTMKTFNHHGTSLVKIKPWVEMSTEDIFVIRYDKIITMTETSDQKIIQVYDRYLSDDDNDEEGPLLKNSSSRVNISQKMGYLTSVEEARRHLEDMFKIPPKDIDKDVK